MRVSLYRLSFPYGLHLSPHELSLDETLPLVPADTLFSALTWAWIRQGGDPHAWLEPFCQGDPPFLLTSAFPWIEGEPWFPKPLNLRPTRAWKEVPFLPEARFFRLARGEEPGEPPAWPPRSRPPWEVAQIPRVSLDRVSLRSNLFYIARVRFREGCGLWFGVAWRAPERPCGSGSFREAVEAALGELREAGLGGDRSVGYGRLEFAHVDDVSWPDPNPQGFGLLLSRLWPRPEELDLLRQARVWRVSEVGGYAETLQGHVRRLRVRLVVEGSVVPTGLRGGLADLTPNGFQAHKIWRYGFALLFPWEVADAA